LFDLVTDNLIQENEIEGDGYIALGITTYGFSIGTASLNRFIDNDIEDFKASFADVFFDANAQNNLLIGECKSVIDLGVRNSATCNEQGTGNSTSQPSTMGSAVVRGAPAPAVAWHLMKQQRLEMFTTPPHAQPQK
jgi:hypothetical protein